MAIKDRGLGMVLFVFLLGAVSSVPAVAASAVIGSVAGSANATLGGKALLPNTTIFSGDSLQVKSGVAVVAIGKSTRMVFGRETVVSFLRDSKEITVLLSQGNVSLYHPDDSVALRVKAGGVAVTPAAGFKTLGDVAMINGAVVVTSKDGLLRVEGNGPAVEVARGKTLTVLPNTARSAAKSPAVIAAPGAVSGLSTALSVGSVAAGGLSAVLAGVAISRANDAKTAGTAAATAANQADTDAKAATSAANAATSAATASTSAGNAATAAANAAASTASAAAAAANAAQATSLTVGCALNRLATLQGLPSSPFTPPAGSTCP